MPGSMKNIAGEGCAIDLWLAQERLSRAGASVGYAAIGLAQSAPTGIIGASASNINVAGPEAE